MIIWPGLAPFRTSDYRFHDDVSRPILPGDRFWYDVAQHLWLPLKPDERPPGVTARVVHLPTACDRSIGLEVES